MRILPSLFLWASFCSFAACERPQHDQFDFWLGQWQVYSQGELAGINHITEDLDNCVIHEHYRTDSGYEGRSLNIYNARTGTWHQTWMDNTGLLLQLEGGLQDQQMVLEGKGLDKQGRPVQHRISWTPLDQDKVRQHWQIKRRGETWQTLFDGLYRPEQSQQP